MRFQMGRSDGILNRLTASRRRPDHLTCDCQRELSRRRRSTRWFVYAALEAIAFPTSTLNPVRVLGDYGTNASH